jgi:hypothetical protein
MATNTSDADMTKDGVDRESKRMCYKRTWANLTITCIDIHAEITKDGLTSVLKIPRTITPTEVRLRITAALNRPAAYSELKAHIKGKPAKDAKRIDTPQAMQAVLELLDGVISRARKNTPVLVITDLMVCCFFPFKITHRSG